MERFGNPKAPLTKKQERTALKAFVTLSDEEQTKAITDVLDGLGIFDSEDNLKPDWEEILAAARSARKAVVR
jgi:hypothetical protein